MLICNIKKLSISFYSLNKQPAPISFSVKHWIIQITCYCYWYGIASVDKERLR